MREKITVLHALRKPKFEVSKRLHVQLLGTYFGAPHAMDPIYNELNSSRRWNNGESCQFIVTGINSRLVRMKKKSFSQSGMMLNISAFRYIHVSHWQVCQALWISQAGTYT